MMSKYPLAKTCVVCGVEFHVKNGAEARKVACSSVCGNTRAAKARSGASHWNWQSRSGIRRPFLGRSHSADTKQQISAHKLGAHAWNKGRKGVSPETRLKMSTRKLGMRLHQPTEFRRGMTPWNIGQKSPQSSGPKNPNWKGGITPERNRVRASVEYKAWERGVMERDGLCCQRCGEGRRGRLTVHHIMNFAQHADLRLDVNNGLTMCRACHREFHKKYSKRNNTREQVLAFLSTPGLNDKMLGGGYVVETVH